MPYKDKEVQKAKNREYQKKYYQKRKKYYKNKAKERQDFLKNFIERVKRFCNCSICGENRWWVLDFHHKNNKEFSIGDASRKGVSIENLKEEIRKCDVLCANCHRDLHYKEKLRGV